MLKKSAFILLIIYLITTLSGGCASPPANPAAGESLSAEAEMILTPQMKSSQKPFRIAVVDIDPYPPASLLFYNLLLRLQDLGWMNATPLPFDSSQDIRSMVEDLNRTDIGPYLRFVPEACYYLAYDGEEGAAAGLKQQAASAEGIDLIIAMGTQPGLFAKQLNLNIPVVVTMATDPVASGIVDSESVSGNPNIWALIERDPMQRQLQYYHKIHPFKHLGMVVPQGEEVMAGIPRYQAAAAALGVQVSEIAVERRQVAPEEYKKLLKENFHLLIGQGVDSYLLVISVIEDAGDCRELFQEFYDHHIPVFVSDGDDYVQGGGLLAISSYDYAGYGMFCADAVSSIFNGAKAGELPNLYTSPPYISFNLEVAKEINFHYDFNFLLACENIYTTEERRGR